MSEEVPPEHIRELPQQIQLHVHKWEILDVWHPNQSMTHPRVAFHATTHVLVRCTECNFPNTVELQGQWTLEQIRKAKDGK